MFLGKLLYLNKKEKSFIMIQSIGRLMPHFRRLQTISVATNALSTVPFNAGPVSGVDTKLTDPLFVQSIFWNQME